MKNQNLIVSRERLDDHKYMVFISIHSLCRLKHELKDIFSVHLLHAPCTCCCFRYPETFFKTRFLSNTSYSLK